MINKFKYIFVFLIFILISFLIINFPKTYFYFHDQNMLNHVSTNQLNLENIYDNYNLTNAEKLEILSSVDLTSFLMIEEPTREKYEQNIAAIKEEIKKINPYLNTVFEEYFILNYDSLTVFNIERYYLSSDDYRGLTLKSIYYSDDIFGINLIMDAYDNTIFGFSIINTGMKLYQLEIDDSLANIDADFKKYLNIDKDLDHIIQSNLDNECYYGCEIITFSIDYSDYNVDKQYMYDESKFLDKIYN